VVKLSAIIHGVSRMHRCAIFNSFCSYKYYCNRIRNTISSYQTLLNACVISRQNLVVFLYGYQDNFDKFLCNRLVTVKTLNIARRAILTHDIHVLFS